MANADTPYGLIPCNRNGGDYEGTINLYYVPSSDGTALAVGDVVKLAGSSDADGVPTVTRANGASGTDTVGVLGVIVGFKVDPSYLDLPNYRAVSTARYCFVADDPNAYFVVQEDSVGGALAATNLGMNIDCISAAPSATTGVSNFEIDSSTVATTVTLNYKLYRLYPAVDNEIGTNAKWIIAINQHQHANNTVGV